MKQKNLILMVVAVGCGLVAAFLTTQINAKGPRAETVEVIVAAKDLPVGTMMSKTELPKLITRKKMPKDSLPTKFVSEESEMLDKRLSAPVLADQTFNPDTLSNRGVIILPDGKDMISLPMSPAQAAAGFIGPGSKVDVLAALRVNSKLLSFPLLVNMHVLAVDTHTSYDTKTATFPNMNSVSLAVTQEQALLLAMAKLRGCHLELLLRSPNKPEDGRYNVNEVKRMLQDDNGLVKETTGRGGDLASPSDMGTTVAPVEAPKVEMVKVLKATAAIPANTEITKDLIAQSFVEKEIPKEHAESLQACTDLSQYYGWVFKTEVSKEQLVIKSMIGQQTSKPGPREEFVPDKAAPMVEAKPEPKPVVAPKPTHDVYFYTPSTTLIHRYEEVAPGEWRLKAVLTPEQAARDQKEAATPGSSEEPAKPAKPTENRKID